MVVSKESSGLYRCLKKEGLSCHLDSSDCCIKHSHPNNALIGRPAAEKLGRWPLRTPVAGKQHILLCGLSAANWHTWDAESSHKNSLWNTTWPDIVFCCDWMLRTHWEIKWKQHACSTYLLEKHTIHEYSGQWNCCNQWCVWGEPEIKRTSWYRSFLNKRSHN